MIRPTWRNDGDRLLLVGANGILWLTPEQLQGMVQDSRCHGLPGYGLSADQIVRHEKGYLVSASHVGAGQISVRRYLASDFDALFAPESK